MRYIKSIIFCCCLCVIVSCAQMPVQNNRSSGLRSLRVLTYNIHHGNPPSRPGIIDLDAIANVIKQQKPDIVSLQEIDVNTARSGTKLDEANELGRLTGMKAYFAKAIDYDGGSYGVAVLSKLPMEGMKNNRLPTADGTKGEPRTLGTSIITLPDGKKIVFAFTHLDAQRASTNRLLQIRKIVEILQTEKLPVIIAGDFNATPGSEEINILDSTFTRTCIADCGFTIPVETPKKTIDFIAYKPAGSFRVMEHKVIDEKYASDHLPVLAVLEVK